MAINIASSSNTTWATGARTITNPSGLTAGDYMLLIVGANSNAVASQTGWTEIFKITHDAGAGIYSEIGAWYKQATAGDVSAGSVTTTSNTGGVAYTGTLLRITSSTTPVFRLAGSNTNSFGATGLSHVIKDNPVALVMTVAQSVSTGTDGTFSGYTITSGVSNPTWTEIIDQHRSTSTEATFAVASAQANLDTTITEFSVSHTGASNAKTCALVSIQEPVSVTGTVSLLTTTPEFFGNTATVGTTGTNSLLEQNPVFFDNQGKGTAPTQWTDEEKSTKTWTDEEKQL